jgi:hypothetical protein
MSNPPLSNEPDLGYDFHPGTAGRYPGHPQLDIFLREKPTLRHFDPRRVQLEVSPGNGRVETLIITHPWTGQGQYRVCAGRIYIDDRKRKRIEAFSCGGQLEISAQHDVTVCQLTSTTPIFDLTDSDSLSTAIASEIEVLLAERRADWDPKHPHTFEQHLATVVPLELYARCLVALHERFAPYLDHHDHLYHQLVHFVIAERTFLQETGQWPPILPSLTELL